MLNPTPGRLLTGVADALDETVLPTMERGTARSQVMAAIGIVRRCALAVDTLGPVLHAECVDLAQVVRSITDADPGLVADRPDLTTTLRRADEALAERYPSVPTLTETVLSLHELVAELAVAAERQESGQRSSIRAILQRMTERRDTLGLSPW